MMVEYMTNANKSNNTQVISTLNRKVKGNNVEYSINGIKNNKYNSVAIWFKSSNRGSMIIPIDDLNKVIKLLNTVTKSDITKLKQSVKGKKQKSDKSNNQNVIAITKSLQNLQNQIQELNNKLNDITGD